MPTVSVRLENVHTDEIRQLGPVDFVQLTYALLRVGPDGEPIAECLDGWWILAEDNSQWTDVIIGPTE
jgi:hypothetical protein